MGPVLIVAHNSIKVLKEQLSILGLIHDHQALMLQLTDEVLFATMAYLEMREFRIVITFSQKSNPRSLPGNGAGEGSEAKTFHFELIP
jgi:hypothetical protein